MKNDMIYHGHEVSVELNDLGNRPEAITVDGEIYTVQEQEARYGYTWRAMPDGAVWFYRSESGKDFRIPKKVLTNTFSPKLYRAYKETGLTQREYAARLGVPLRTFEDWIAGRREPSKLVQRTILGE